MHRSYRSVILGILPLALGTLARADNPTLKADQPRASIPTDLAFTKVIALTNDIARPGDRAHILGWIARAQAFSGHKEASRRTFALAIGLVDKLSSDESGYQPHILAWVGHDQELAGDRDGAVASYRKAVELVIATPLKEDRFNPYQYATIIGYQMKAGDVAGAHASFEKVRQVIANGKGPFIENYGELWMIGFQALVGDFDAAFQAIAAKEAKPNPRLLANFRSLAFEEIARAIGSANPAGGRAVLERMLSEIPTIKGNDPLNLAIACHAIADAAAQIGASDLALRAVASVNDDLAQSEEFQDILLFKRGLLLTQIARVQAKAGRRDQAKATLDRAVKVARMLGETPAGKGVLSFAQEAQIEIGDVTTLAGDNPLSLLSVDKQLRIAAIQENAGDLNAARKTHIQALAEAEADLRNLKPELPMPDGNPLGWSFAERKDHAAAKVVSLKAELGDTTAAFAQAWTIQSPSARDSAVTAVARASGRYGDVDAAATWIRGLEEPELRARCVEALAYGLAARNAPPEPVGNPNR